MHMQWRSNGYRDECQALEVDRKVGGQTMGKEQAFKTDKQKQKGFLHLTSKPVNLKYASSSSLAHNNRLQFQTSCFAGSICGGSNAKGGIEVKLANVRRCR